MKNKLPSLFIGTALLALCTSVLPAGNEANNQEITLTLKAHRFEPNELKVAANRRIRLTVHNQDATPEEFESHALKREKVIAAGAKAVILIGPLKPGRYEFFGEFHPTTAQGVLVVE